jgi:ABC-type transport system involved in Fe-S cluster assembly fused permease/ATPase subunit
VGPLAASNLSLNLWQITRGIHTDCLLNYETVKYFGGEDHEGERYADAIRAYQTYEYQVMSAPISFTGYKSV